MSTQTQHRDVAWMILVGRALALAGKGLPWSFDDDAAIILRERLLWARLTPAEQALEQEALAQFWGRRGLLRTVVVNPEWGAWTEGLSLVTIPDAAFGSQDFRPSGRGIEVLAKEYPKFVPAFLWLWRHGFQPISLVGDTVQLSIPSHRIVQETERLVGALAGANLEVLPVNRLSAKGVRIQGHYDPATGQATLSVFGAGELLKLDSAGQSGE